MTPQQLAKMAMQQPLEGVLLNEIRDFAQNLADGKNKLTTNQLRKFFGHLRALQQMMLTKNKNTQIDPSDKEEIEFLKVYVAYSAARTKRKDTKVKDFYQFIDSALSQLRTYGDFFKMVKVLEAVVAFHKVAEEQINLN